MYARADGFELSPPSLKVYHRTSRARCPQRGSQVAPCRPYILYFHFGIRAPGFALLLGPGAGVRWTSALTGSWGRRVARTSRVGLLTPCFGRSPQPRQRQPGLLANGRIQKYLIQARTGSSLSSANNPSHRLQPCRAWAVPTPKGR